MIDRRTRRHAARWAIGWLALGVLAIGASTGPAAAEPSQRRVALAGRGFLWAHDQLDRLRQAMTRWSRGEMPDPDEARLVFAAGFDPRTPPETVCIRAIEHGLVEHLEEQDPSLLLPLALWQTEMVLTAQAWTGAAIPDTEDFERVEDYLVRFRDGASRRAGSRAGREQVRRTTLLAYLGVGEIYVQRGAAAYLARAAGLFDQALALDRDMEAARYWSAFLSEKIRPAYEVLRPWRELAADHPDDPEYRLRLGLVARRADRADRAAESLESVARSSAPEWMRVLAYEEWVQVLLHGSDRERRLARDLLAEARGQLPGHLGLDVLAVYAELPERRRSALRLAERIESRLWPVDHEPPRIRYEQPQADQVDAARQELFEQLQLGRADLARELASVNPSHLFREHVVTTCQPLMPG